MFKMEDNSKLHIFLDDFRIPVDAFRILGDTDFLKLKWDIVRSYDEFINKIIEEHNKGRWPELISWDHDLLDEHYEIGEKSNFTEFDYSLTEKTGWHAAQWLIEFCKTNNLTMPPFKVHSQNTAGRKSITTILEEFRR